MESIMIAVTVSLRRPYTNNICSVYKVLLPGFVQDNMQGFGPVVHPYSSSDTAVACKNSYFILSERSDFHTVNNSPCPSYVYVDIASVDGILLPRYIIWSTNFRSLPLNEKVAQS